MFLTRLSHEWQAYISRTNKLRKTFISVKGTYYQVIFLLFLFYFRIWYLKKFLNRRSCIFLCSFTQVEIEGQKITWLTPHALQQVITDDVDFKVMLTFLEFYEVRLLSFTPSLFLSHLWIFLAV